MMILPSRFLIGEKRELIQWIPYFLWYLPHSRLLGGVSVDSLCPKPQWRVSHCSAGTLGPFRYLEISAVDFGVARLVSLHLLISAAVVSWRARQVWYWKGFLSSLLGLQIMYAGKETRVLVKRYYVYMGTVGKASGLIPDTRETAVCSRFRRCTSSSELYSSTFP